MMKYYKTLQAIGEPISNKCSSLGGLLALGNRPPTTQQHAKIQQVIDALKSGNDDADAQTKLMTFALSWIVENPQPIALGEVSYKI